VKLSLKQTYIVHPLLCCRIKTFTNFPVISAPQILH